METKKCTHPDCLRELPLEEFDFQAKHPEKRYSWCNECRKKANLDKSASSKVAQKKARLATLKDNLRQTLIELEELGDSKVDCLVCHEVMTDEDFSITKTGKLNRMHGECQARMIANANKKKLEDRSKAERAAKYRASLGV